MTKRTTHSKSIFSRHLDVMVCLFIILSTFSVYWQIHNYDFVNFDDYKYVSDNRHVQVGLTIESITWAFTTFHAGNWHPLTWLSHMLDYQLYGLNPGGHHITNLFFHIANSLLLFFVFRKMTGHFWQSAFLALLFALHPLHVESVAWISERKDVLSAFFWILTMWSYIRYVQHPGIDKYLLVLLFFILGLMSKPMLVTLPFVLLLMDYYPLSRFQKSDGGKNIFQRSIVFRVILEKLPFFVLVVISSAITFYAQMHGGAVKSLEIIPIQTRIANALISYAAYILKMLCPSRLAVLYPHPGSFPWWQIAGACFLLLSISFLAIRIRKQSPYFITGWLWYLGTLVPVIGLVQVGNQSMADRYSYIPLIGIFFIISWGIPQFIQRWRHVKKILPIIAITISFILMGVTFIQAGYWKNSIILFKHALGITANNFIIHNNLGLVLREQGLIDEAIRHYEDALRIRPDFVEAHYNLGNALQEQGLIDNAIRHYKEALRIKPDFVDAHNNLGNAFQEQGLIDNAIRHYKEALRIKPDFADAHNNLGFALKEKGLIDEAVRQYKEALHIRPDYEKAHYNLGNALQEKGLIDESLRHYKEALRIKPDYADAHNNLGLALKEKGLIDEAIRHYEEAIHIRPDFEKAHYNLGNALQEKGLIDDAIRHYKEALRIRPDFEKAHNNLGLALKEKGLIDEAIRHYEEALRIRPDFVEAHNNLGIALFYKGDIDGAIERFQHALRINPEYLDAKNNLNLLLSIQKQ